MRLSNLHMRENDGLIRAVATVAYEDCGQPEQEIFIETEATFAEDIFANPHAFVVGCIIPALYFGERRLFIDETICPRLKEGLETVMALMHHWTEGKLQPLAIDASLAKTALHEDRNRHAAVFLSGGMDSLAALKLIKDNYADTHPSAPKDALLVHGFDIGGVVKRGAKYPVFERAKTAMAPVATDAGLTLIPIYTNIRHLCDDRDLWLNQFFGAVLVAAAHVFSKRINLAWLASSYDIPHLHPCGSHPLLDPEYGSHDLCIRHRDAGLSRMKKLKIVAGWDVAFQNFRVCLANVPDKLNCGRCEKCVRTMLELEALGLLNKTRAFEENAVDPSWLDAFSIIIRVREPFYEELIEPLRARGRDDLAEKIEGKLKGF
ncbi:MAG: hypothetical protein HGJ94_15875 [Desulfosarcina sp.]|nr:hypothetical protein [Desulfosarcina sp.]MBC2741796.1 hypothetical protein [Desulfosarcina sp.]MBC2764710.1 hypothetical protein [Desulfosarcina sp.]